jgi:gluconolactonase
VRNLTWIVVASRPLAIRGAAVLLALAACSDSPDDSTPALTPEGTPTQSTGGSSGSVPGSAGSGGTGGSKPISGGSGAAASGSGASAAGSSGAGGSRPTAGTSGSPGAGSGGSNAGAGASGAAASGAGGVSGAAGSGAEFHCPLGPFGMPVPTGAVAQRIAGVPPLDAFNDNGNTRTNIEGAVWIADRLYVSEFPLTPAPGSRILAIDPTSKAVSIALASSGTNGMAVDSMGNLIATDHKAGAVVRMAFPLGAPVVLTGAYGGQRFNSPNDVAVRSDGNLYFSDPDYQAPSTRPQPQTRVYRVAPGASEATVIDATRSEPNGVTLSPDERTLYVSGSDGILSYPILTDGSITAGSGARVNGFSGGSDGLGMDCAGNLYATSGKRIVVLSPSGVEIGSISVSQAENVTNVAFGGPAHKTLFITSMGTGDQRGVFQAELNVPGMPY